MSTTWETDIASLLDDLLGVQGELLNLLGRKRDLIVAGDTAALDALAGEEERLVQALTACVERRQQLLEQAGEQGRPAGSIEELSRSLPQAERHRLHPQVAQARSNSRILQHKSLVNWMVVQRTLIHLSQMLEIIATGGRIQPTYGEGEKSSASGALVDRAA